MLKVIQAVEEVQAAIDQVPDEKKLELALTLTALSKKLLSNISTLGDIPEYYEKTLQPQIDAQLSAAEKRTEKAADSFLGTAEVIGALASKADAGLRNELQEQVNAIFEAASFQDLVAQHLNEVKLRLQELNTHMAALHAVFEGNEEKVKENQKKIRDSAETDGLLNGPSTEI